MPGAVVHNDAVSHKGLIRFHFEVIDLNATLSRTNLLYQRPRAAFIFKSICLALVVFPLDRPIIACVDPTPFDGRRPPTPVSIQGDPVAKRLGQQPDANRQTLGHGRCRGASRADVSIGRYITVQQRLAKRGWHCQCPSRDSFAVGVPTEMINQPLCQAAMRSLKNDC